MLPLIDNRHFPGQKPGTSKIKHKFAATHRIDLEFKLAQVLKTKELFMLSTSNTSYKHSHIISQNLQQAIDNQTTLGMILYKYEFE